MILQSYDYQEESLLQVGYEMPVSRIDSRDLISLILGLNLPLLVGDLQMMIGNLRKLQKKGEKKIFQCSKTILFFLLQFFLDPRNLHLDKLKCQLWTYQLVTKITIK